MKTDATRQKEKPRNRRGEYVPEKLADRYVKRPIRRLGKKIR